MKDTLTGRLALVTGAGRGNGAAIAAAFATIRPRAGRNARRRWNRGLRIGADRL